MTQVDSGVVIDGNLTDRLAEVSTRARLVSRRVNTILAEDGMNEDLWRVMHVLSQMHGMLMGELAQSLVLPSPTATRLIDELVGAGLVFRRPSPDDGRKIVVYLSRIGHERLKRLTALLLSRAEELADLAQVSR